MLVAACAFAAFSCAIDEPPVERAQRSPLGGDSALVAMFEAAGAEHGVPPELLATIAYQETRLRMTDTHVHAHDGHGPAAVGLMALFDGIDERDLAQAAALAGVELDAARTDAYANIRAAAALLAARASGDERALADWMPVVRGYGGQPLVSAVSAHLARGWTGLDAAGGRVTCSARAGVELPDDGIGTSVHALGYPGAIWNPAHGSNYSNASRGAAQINYIIIHTVQGSYAGCISWFKNSSSNVSAHYVVRSSDGEVTQMVDDADIAWHDGCFNSETIGIEHEGYVSDPDTWYTEAMYLASAQLSSWLADQYGIPKDRAHIMGHGEAPDCSDHTDPGGGWNWDHYMALVNTGGTPTFDASFVEMSYPSEMVSGDEVVAWVEMRNDCNITWGLNETRLGTAEPQDRESAFYVEGNWLSPNRATGADHSTYTPGTDGRFTFLLRAPEVTETTVFEEKFQLVQEGEAWFGPTVTMSIVVHPRGGGEDPPDVPEPPGDPGDMDPPADDIGDGTGTGEPGGNGGVAGGCAAAGSGASPTACAMLLLGALVLGRRRRAR